MAIKKFSDIPNQGITVLNGVLSDSATTIPVDSMADLKLTGLTGTDFAYCKITKQENWRQHPINRKESFEIIKVTAVSANDLTATRGVDGTSGTTFADGDIVEVAFSSIHYQDIVDAITDGTAELNIGKLGVGMPPVDAIHVNGASGGITLTETDSTNDAVVISSNINAGIIDVFASGTAKQAHFIGFGNGWVNANNGDFGIGTDSPEAQLHVAGDVQIDDDTYWVGAGSGIPFGHMYIDGAQSIVVALTVNTPAEVKDDGTTSADDGWLAGELNLITMAAADLHYFSSDLAGKYEIIWDMSFNLPSPGANVEIHGGIAIDGTPVRFIGEAHRTIANNTDTGNMCGLATLDLAADAQISLWLENTTNSADVTAHHGNVTVKMVGG